MIPKREKDEHVFKDLHITSLISLGQLCDDGCTDILDKKIIHIVKGNHLFFRKRKPNGWVVGHPFN